LCKIKIYNKKIMPKENNEKSYNEILEERNKARRIAERRK
jgi:hypothetical protein